MNKKEPADAIALFSIAQLVLGIVLASKIQTQGVILKYAIGYCIAGSFLIITSIGLLRFNNLARLLGQLWAMFFICGFFYIIVRCFFQPDANAFMFLVFNIPVFLFYVAFLLYFTRPKIKQLYES